eukprot:scaffold1972_cov265-Chaetoceros_neogracile.AAC.8
MFLLASKLSGVYSFSTLPINNIKHDIIANGRYQIEILSEDPQCFLVRDFLSEDECEAYISKTRNADAERMKQSNAPQVSLQIERLWPLPFLCIGAGVPPIIRLFEGAADISMIGLDDIVTTALVPIGMALGVMLTLLLSITKLMQQYADTSSRTSESLALNTPADCDFIRNLVDRASEITDQPWDHWEAPVITKYSKGALFASHNDASPTRGSEWADLGGQRVATVITYLNTCQDGGSTKFDQLNFQVQPMQGSALVFFPADGETLEVDERTTHQSLFGRHQKVPSPLGIPDSYADTQ